MGDPPGGRSTRSNVTLLSSLTQRSEIRFPAYYTPPTKWQKPFALSARVPSFERDRPPVGPPLATPQLNGGPARRAVKKLPCSSFLLFLFLAPTSILSNEGGSAGKYKRAGGSPRCALLLRCVSSPEPASACTPWAVPAAPLGRACFRAAAVFFVLFSVLCCRSCCCSLFS